jgi:hypothetical protein
MGVEGVSGRGLNGKKDQKFSGGRVSYRGRMGIEVFLGKIFGGKGLGGGGDGGGDAVSQLKMMHHFVEDLDECDDRHGLKNFVNV